MDAEPEAVDELVQRCAHLPLALSVVASRAAATPTFPLAVLVEQLRDEQDRLDALDVGDDTGVRAVFSWSYRALSADAARMFRLLGLPAGAGADISLGAAAALAGLAQRPTRRLLDDLGRAHLLEEYLPGRYRFHDLLRAYAAECAEDETDADHHAAVRRLLNWYLHTAHNADRQLRPRHYAVLTLPNIDVTPVAFSAYAEALAWYEIERANLFLAIRQAAANGLHTHAWQLPRTLMHFCRRRGYIQDWCGALHLGLASARHLGDLQAEADILHEIAIATERNDDSLLYHKQALALYQEIGDLDSAAVSGMDVGVVLGRLKRYDDAIAYLHQALRDVARINKGEALNSLGVVYAALERYDEAIKYHLDALVLHRDTADTTDPLGEGFTLHELGDVYLDLRRLDQAVSYYRNALAVLRRIGERPVEGMTLWKLGTALRQIGDLAGARECWQQALAIFDDLGRPEADEVRAQLSDLDGTTA